MNSQSILIINPEEAIRESLSLVLGEEGYNCITDEGQDSIQSLVQDQSVGLIILDSHIKTLLGLLDALELAKNQAKVLLISSYAESEITEEALAHGVHDFVLKPLDFDELIQKVKALLLPTSQ